MAFSDQLIYQALQQLVIRCGPDEIISQSMISSTAAVNLRTTGRALHRLMQSGHIEGEFTRGIGYRYAIAGAGAGGVASNPDDASSPNRLAGAGSA